MSTSKGIRLQRYRKLLLWYTKLVFHKIYGQLRRIARGEDYHLLFDPAFLSQNRWQHNRLRKIYLITKIPHLKRKLGRLTDKCLTLLVVQLLGLRQCSCNQTMHKSELHIYHHYNIELCGARWMHSARQTFVGSRQHLADETEV